MQKYTEIQSSQKLSESLSLILNNDKTAITCNAGTAFPTVDLRDGMLCYRRDELKLYELVDAEVGTWRVIADLSGNARLLDGGFGNAIDYSKRDLNSYDSMPTGFYEGTNMLNQPSGDTAWRVIQFRGDNTDGYSSQLAFGTTTGKLYTRYQRAGMWGEWQELYSGRDAGVVSGLNADKLDGHDAGNNNNDIPINNGTLNVNLNADKLDGKDAGNASGNVPINNGVKNEGLNADKLDGFDAGNASNQVPINNGKLNVNLNAEMLGGVKVKNVLQVNDDGSIPRTVTLTFENLLRSRVFPTSGVRDRCVQVSSNPSGIVDIQTTTGNSGSDYVGQTYVLHTDSGVKTGTYSLGELLGYLVASSHDHRIERKTNYYNCACNCRCDCDCDGGDDGP